MKKFISLLIVLIIVFTSIDGFAADGDIIHTGLKKIYRKGTDEISEDLMDDILNHVDQHNFHSKFYRELDGKYINVKGEEDAHLAYLRDLMIEERLLTPEDLMTYLENNASKVEEGLDRISIEGYEIDSNNIFIGLEDFDEIKLSPSDKIEDFQNSSSALKLTKANFSTPEPGNQVGYTKISTLNLPINSTKWKINTSREKIWDIKKGSLVSEVEDYIAHRDIAIIPGNYLNLYAVDRQDKLIAFSSIKIEENMIKKPTIYAADLEEDTHYTGPLAGEEIGTSKFSDLDFKEIDGDTWNIFISKGSISKPELDSLALGSPYNVGDDIDLVVGDSVLLTASKDNKIKAYALVHIREEHIKPKEDEAHKRPLLLQAGRHFAPLIKGSRVAWAKFPWLNPRDIEGDIVWRYVVSNKNIPIPELDSMIEGEGFDVGVLGKDNLENMEIEIMGEAEIPTIGTINKNIMLIATLEDGEDYKIKAYASLKADNNNVKMPNAEKLTETSHFTMPVKGGGEYTTRIENLDSSDITDFNQWRYKLVDNDIEDIEFNSVFSNSSFYRENVDIPTAKAGDYLILAATDGFSRLKMYTSIKLEGPMIRGKNADYLISPANYNHNDPSPGSAEATTKFNTLSFSTNIKGGKKWMVKTSTNNLGPIEMDSIVDNAQDYTIGEDIKDVSINDYVVLLATDNAGKVKAFAEFRLMENNIKGGDPAILREGSGPGENYIIERGNTPSTTRFTNLKFDGVFGASNWKYKWMENKLDDEDLPYLNQVVADSQYYSVYNNIGEDIGVSWVSDEDKYGYILLLAVDNYGETKGYVQVDVDSSVVKEHAPKLSDAIKLLPGDTTDKVRFKVKLEKAKESYEELDPATPYMYVLDNFEYITPALDDKLHNGENYDGDITVRIGQHLTLFEVNSENKIKGFKRFLVKSEDIKQGSADFALIDNGEGKNWLAEGKIVNGGSGIKIILKDAQWADGIDKKPIRDDLFSGFKADKNVNQWFNVITRLISDGGGISISETNTPNDTIHLYLPNTPGYDISEDQEIKLIIPPEAIKGAINPIEASGSIIIKPTVEALVSGDVVDKIIREKDLIDGNVDIVITLLDGNWIGEIDKDVLIEGFEGGENWDIIKDEYKNHGVFTRNSSKKVTLTLTGLPADLESSINLGSSREDVNVIIPKELIQGATVDVEATPIFSIYPDVLKIHGEASEDTVIMQAPEGKDILQGHNTWRIKLNNSSFIENLTDKEIRISNLPRGLSYKIERIDDENMDIKISGSATGPIGQGADVILRINASAVNEPNSQDSDNIVLKIKVNEAKDFEGVGYKLEDDKIYLTVPEALVNNVEYSIDSTNGINGRWDKINVRSQSVSLSLKPVKVWLRERLQPKVFAKVLDLDYEPTPVNIGIKAIDYEEVDDGESNGKILKKVTLDGVDATMEYSLDGGKNWTKFSSDTPDPITLDEDSDLRIRVAPVIGDSGNLPSLTTKRLNGLFLGDVSLEVGAGKISKTETSMEYSLDSENGKDGKWSRASAGETMINFKKDNRVWIREGKSNINLWKLGEVSEKAKPDLFDENGGILVNEEGQPLIQYNILEKTLENKTDKVLEYKMANGSWHLLNAETSYIDFSSGNLDIRTRGDANTLPSPGVTLVSIAKPIEPPEIKADDNDKLIYYFDGIWKEINDDFQYKIATNGIWKSGKEFENDDYRYESVIVYVRKRAGEKVLPSIEKSISFTKNLTFENVRYNVVDKKLESVSSRIEYSTNSSDQKNGIWKDIKASSISIEPFEGMYLWIREVNKPSTELLLVTNLERWNKPILGRVYYNLETNKIANQTSQNLEYKISNGQWTRLDAQSDAYGVDFVPGNFEFRQRATGDKMASQLKLKTIIKAKVSGPNIEFSDIENTVEFINGTDYSEWKKFEYRIDPEAGSPWINGELLAGEDLSGHKLVEIRSKADRNTLSSQITSINFRKNLELEKVILSQHIDPHELNGTTSEMEYQIYLNNGERTGWVQCDNDNTLLPSWLKTNINLDNVKKIEIRDGRAGLNEDIIKVY